MMTRLVAGAFAVLALQACLPPGGGGGYYAAPVAQAPAPEPDPAYQDPAYQDPAYQEPAYQEPAYQEPAYQAPAYQEPASQPPSYQPNYTVSYTRITPEGVFIGTDGQRDPRDTATGQRCDTLDRDVPACPTHYICNGGDTITSNERGSSQPGACMADGNDSYWR